MRAGGEGVGHGSLPRCSASTLICEAAIISPFVIPDVFRDPIVPTLRCLSVYTMGRQDKPGNDNLIRFAELQSLLQFEKVRPRIACQEVEALAEVVDGEVIGLDGLR